MAKYDKPFATRRLLGARTPIVVPRGRVWPDGEGMFYWACYACIERLCTGKPIDGPGGKASTIASGHQYLQWHSDAWHDPDNDRWANRG